MSKHIVIPINFNNLRWSDKRLTKEWIEERIDIFYKYTLRSLKAQTNQQFTAYLYYDINSKEIVEEILSTKEKLPTNIIFTDRRQGEEHFKEQCKNSDWLYIVRLDSDNLFQKDYIQKLQEYQHQETTQAIVTTHGYLYAEKSEPCIYPYYQKSPPFYTLVYPAKHYIRGKRYSFRGHGEVVQRLKCEYIEGYNYMVTIHGSNHLNGEFLYKRKTPITHTQEVLLEFGMK